MNMTPLASPSEEEASIKYVCGVDVGSQSCAGCMCRPDKSVVVKSITFANTREPVENSVESASPKDQASGT
jgi:transposase